MVGAKRSRSEWLQPASGTVVTPLSTAIRRVEGHQTQWSTLTRKRLGTYPWTVFKGIIIV